MTTIPNLNPPCVTLKGKVSEYADGVVDLVARQETDTVHITGGVSSYANGTVDLRLTPRPDGSVLIQGQRSAYADGLVKLETTPQPDGSHRMHGQRSAYADGTTDMVIAARPDGSARIDGHRSSYADGQVDIDVDAPRPDGSLHIQGQRSAYANGAVDLDLKKLKDGHYQMDGAVSRLADGQVSLTMATQGDARQILRILDQAFPLLGRNAAFVAAGFPLMVAVALKHDPQ